MKRRGVLSGLLASTCWGLPGCGSPGSSQIDGPVDVPMQVDDPQVSVQVHANGQPLRFLLDSGADAHVVSPALATALGLVLSDAVVPASGGSGAVAGVRWTRIDELSVGAARQRGVPAVVMPLPPELGFDGLLGASFFRDFAPQLDYAARRLRLTAYDRQSEPANAGVRLPLQVLPGGKLLVQARVAGVDGWFSVDTGAGNVVTLFRPTVDRLGLRQALQPTVRMVTGLTVSGPDQGDLARAPELVIGPWRLAGPVVELSLAQAGLFGSDGWAGNLGGALWRRFAVTLDPARGQITLVPNAELHQPFAAPRSGLAYQLQAGEVRVIGVAAGSPAARAGLQLQDHLLSVQGQVLRPDTLALLRSALRQAAGTAITLRVRRTAGADAEHVLTLADLV